MQKKIITGKEEIEQIIQQAQACYLAMVDENNLPYVVPMNFGYTHGEFHLHSGPHGKKMRILKKNNDVCLSLDVESKLNHVSENVACSYSMIYKSLIANGKVFFIDDINKKIESMNIIMKHYTGREFTYNRPAIENVSVFIMKVKEMTVINRGITEF